MYKLENYLPLEKVEKILNGLVNIKYNLLIGAGVSQGSLGGDKKPMPSGRQLTKELCEEFGIPFDENDSNINLKSVFSLARNEKNKRGEDVFQYLNYKFTHTEPAQVYFDINKIKWNLIWNLNIDDCFEQVGRKYLKSQAQSISCVSYSDSVEFTRSDDKVKVVQMHGKARNAAKDPGNGGLIFDISQYTSDEYKESTWRGIFKEQYQTKPFIILGGSVLDEIDITPIIDSTEIWKRDEPTIVVLKSFSDFQRFSFEKKGLICVEATVEEFVSFLAEDLINYISNNSLEAKYYKLDKNLSELKNHWRYLRESTKSRVSSLHHLYDGAEPTWDDYLNEIISERAITKTIADTLTGGEYDIVIIEGESFSGKTAVKYLVAGYLLNADYHVFDLRPFEVFEDAPIYDWVEINPKTVFIIDDATDFAYIISQCIASANPECVPKFLISSRFSRLDHIDKFLHGSRIRKIKVDGKLTKPEIRKLIHNIKRNYKLGRLRNKTNQEIYSYFSDNHNKIFSAMAGMGVEGGEFKTRAKYEIERLSVKTGLEKKEIKEVVSIIALCNYLSYSLPIEFVGALFNKDITYTQNLLENELVDSISVFDNEISFIHRYLGELVFLSLDKDTKYIAAMKLAGVLSKYLSLQSIAKRNVYYRLVRSLMSHETVLRIVNHDNELAYSFYKKLETKYAWNARFWEQRSLLAANNLNFGDAYYWAQESVACHEDDFTLNTLGLILLRREEWNMENGKPLNEKNYLEASNLLMKSLNISLDKEDVSSYEYQYRTFINYSLNLLMASNSVVNMVESKYNEWYPFQSLVVKRMDAKTRFRIENLSKKLGAKIDEINLMMKEV